MSNIVNYFNPSLCNITVLGKMAAMASTIDNIVPPYPLLYTSSNCGAVGGGSFPLYFFPINCNNPPLPIPLPSQNCLRVISASDYNEGKSLLTINQINYLPTDTMHGNIFEDPEARLYSWYVPPQYTFIFFKTDPSVTIPATIPKLEQSSNFLEVDACRAIPFLSDSSSFWTQTPTICTPTIDHPLNFTHNAPYLVIIQNEDFNPIIVDMCTSKRQVLVGTTSLNDVFFPQSPGCDKIMENLCNVNNVKTTEFAEVCSCFTQQQELDKQYPNLKVSVCSFGNSTDGIDKSCAFNTNSYKTKQMLVDCVSFAQCESNVSSNIASNVQCMGEFVEFPTEITPTPSIIPPVYSTTYTIPSFAWVFLAIALIFLALFVIFLAFL